MMNVTDFLNGSEKGQLVEKGLSEERLVVLDWWWFSSQRVA